MKKSLILLASTALSLSLVGCGGNDNDEVNNNNKDELARTNNDAPRNVNYVNNDRNNRTLRLSDRAERQVEQMKEVDDAHVIISNNNAYVAVRLVNDNNTVGNSNNNGNGSFMQNGTVNRDNTNGNGTNGTIDGQGDAGVDNRGNDNGSLGVGNGNQNNNIRDNTGTNYSKVSNNFEQRIADQVRQADRKIHKVYVSVNPDLYNRMGTYVNDIRTNRDRDGLFDDFNNSVRNFFGRHY